MIVSETQEGRLCVDWNCIKAEYITGGTSYRKLAEKYDVSFTTLQRVAKKEKWTELRRQAADKAETKIVETVSKREAKTAVKIVSVADKLLSKLSETIDQMDVIDSKSFKNFASALKDIRDIKGEKSALDIKEQEARIAKLQKEAVVEDKSTEITITIGSDAEEYSV